MQTLLNYRTMARRRLDESAAVFYQDSDLTAWVNEAIEEICARAQIVQSLSTAINLVAGTKSYPLPNDFLLLSRVEAVIAGATTPVYPANRRITDMRFGSGAAQGTPQYYNVFGTPGQTVGADAAVITVFPTPAAGGILNVYYERIPALLVADADTSLIPPGWDRLVTLYVVSAGLMKNRDYEGSDKVLQQYEKGLVEMITNSRQWEAEAEFVDQGGTRRLGAIVQGNAVYSPSSTGGR